MEYDEFTLSGKDDGKQEQKFSSEVIFVSKVFLAKVSMIETLDDRVTEFLNKGGNSDNYILI